MINSAQSLCRIAIIGDNYRFKIATNCLNFTLIMRVFRHNQKYACSTQRSSSKVIWSLVSCTYKYRALPILQYLCHIFLRVPQSDLESIMMKARLIARVVQYQHVSRWNAFHVVQDRIIWMPLLSPRNISTEDIGRHIDVDIQIFISSDRHGKSPSQDARCITRFRRWILRRCKMLKEREDVKNCKKMHKSVDKINNTYFF